MNKVKKFFGDNMRVLKIEIIDITTEINRISNIIQQCRDQGIPEYEIRKIVDPIVKKYAYHTY